MNIRELENQLKDTDYLKDCFDVFALVGEDITSEDELLDFVSENHINTHEIIYYHKALDFLKENDSSLSSSMGIASELCYEIDSITSELLATLLFQQLASEELHELDFDLILEDGN